MVVTTVPAMKFGVRALELIEFIFFFYGLSTFSCVKAETYFGVQEQLFFASEY